MALILDLQSARMESRPVVVGLDPRQWFLEYLGKFKSGDFFAIFRPQKDWGYTDFVCLVGQDELKRVAVEKTVRYRDGGTTKVSIAAGEFVFPTPFNPELKPTFNGEEVEILESLSCA